MQHHFSLIGMSMGKLFLSLDYEQHSAIYLGKINTMEQSSLHDICVYSQNGRPSWKYRFHIENNVPIAFFSQVDGRMVLRV